MATSTAAGRLTTAGRPFPLGAHPEGGAHLEVGAPPEGGQSETGGVRFAVASSVADAVEVCLIDSHDDGVVEHRVELTERTFGVWHGVVPGIGAGQRYGFRVHGPYDPARGLRCNPSKLLVDPYARQITGTVTDLGAALGYSGDPMSGPPSAVDSLGSVPLSVVHAAPGHAAAGHGPAGHRADTGLPPQVPWEETVIYELHVRGFTRTHPDVPEHQRGTYLGLAHPRVIEHLVGLGITAVELLPVAAFSDEPQLLRTGRHNYWGYSPLGLFAPHPHYASQPGQEVSEFRAMVAALHAAGIEVLLDVVFNHTCEGDGTGPTLSLRGLDAPAYYLYGPDGADLDITGCGNTLNAGSPTVIRLVTDALRYWAGEMGVDGFRFDLASVLGRPGGGAFDRDSALLTAIATDPLLCQRKLIAEPWDATAEGYRLGAFAGQWAEWNGRFRDTVRDFWRGATGVRDLAYRLSGSSDLFADSGRRPWQSVNFVTAHDGFTLRDLVSYNDKHNDANGEGGKDGTDDNRSWNCGVEGETSDADVRALRLRQARNLLATLLLSTGTPMLAAGDELWRTQLGNNNPYCLDGEISWLDWSGGEEARALRSFATRAVRLRERHTGLRQAEFFDGHTTRRGTPDLVWFRHDGQEMTEIDWFDEEQRTIGMWIDGSDCHWHTGDGEQVADHSWLLVLHAGAEPTELVLPGPEYGLRYEPVLDTDTPDGRPADPMARAAGERMPLAGRTVLLLRTTRDAA